jgi:hypothetical protein
MGRAVTWFDIDGKILVSDDLDSPDIFNTPLMIHDRRGKRGGGKGNGEKGRIRGGLLLRGFC